MRTLHSRTLEAAGLTAALGELAAHVTRVFGVECRVDDRAGVEPSAASRIHLYRIAREAVLNAARHARAATVAIELSRGSDELVLAVRDDGGAGDRSPLGTLSNRELHVLKLIGRGLGTREIADVLHISIKTVESYRARLKEKLSLRSGIELTRFAVRWATDDGSVARKRDTGDGN